MSSEIFEIVRELDLKDIQTQLALQCAPLITGMKVSNLLIVQNENIFKVRQILKDTDIQYFVLLKTEQKTTMLLYKKNELEAYLSEEQVKLFLMEMGYPVSALCHVLPMLQAEYRDYMAKKKQFPHELGILLGYPVEDVEGFIKNKGRNCLCSGYWKVYEDLAAKVCLFQKFELAKETLIQLISNGENMIDIINRYHGNRQQEA